MSLHYALPIYRSMPLLAFWWSASSDAVTRVPALRAGNPGYINGPRVIRARELASGRFFARQLTQHVVQDAAVAKVLDFLRRQQQHFCLEADAGAITALAGDGGHFAGAVIQTGDVEHLIALESE